MAELGKNQEPGQNNAQFISDVDLLEIREEDTKPGKVSESYRKWLEEKYRGKGATPSNPAGEKKDA